MGASSVPIFLKNWVWLVEELRINGKRRSTGRVHLLFIFYISRRDNRISSVVIWLAPLQRGTEL